MLCVQFFVAEQVVRHAWQLPYRFALNYVSDLGAVHCDAVVCSPLHGVMNASFVLQGVLIGGGAMLLRRRFSPQPAYTVAFGLLVVCGLGVLTVGLAPEDVRNGLHVAGATAHFIAGGLAMLTLGVLLLRDARRRALGGWLSVAMGLAVLGATALLGLRSTPVWASFGLGVGAVERVAAYGIPLWMMGMGAALRGRAPAA